MSEIKELYDEESEEERILNAIMERSSKKEWEKHEDIANELIDKLINKYCWSEEDFDGLSIEDIVSEYEDITDTSWAHPNESEDEFYEHENW